MNLEFSEDQKFIQQNAREYLSENAPLSVCRRVLESDEPYAQDLWKGVAEMGWLGTTVPEEFGGTGLGYLELVLIAQEVGRSLAPIPFSSSVYLATEAILRFGTDEQKKKWLPGLCSGERIGTFAAVEHLGDPDLGDVESALSGGKVSGSKVPVLDGDVANLAVLLVRDGGGYSLAVVDLAASGVQRTSLESFDPSRSQASLALDGVDAEVLGESGKGLEQAEALLDRAAIMMGFEQVGGSERALDITREYTMGRYAFGRPIASFQALKHRMADMYAANQIALSNGYYAAWALSTDNPEVALAACNVRVAASDAFVLAAEEMIQMHGGVGYTWEFDCHLFYRRAKLLALTLGSASAWREKLISRLEAGVAGAAA